GGVEAKVVLSVDAMGPRTAAVAVVAADGRLLHTEDIPCQLTAGMRSAAVTRMGELIHQFGVDLIVVSNGPARRGCLVILHELVEQSTPGSIRWTIAERSGADVYAGSELANREMRSTPRRFRSAAWLAFSVLRPSQAITKVDPMRLRLGSFQRELSEDALWPALRDVMTSGVSRGGVDVNSAPVDWLCQLPGLNRELATAIDKRRRQSLFTSRSELLSMEQWTDPANARQAIAFLRVFGSEETLDGTLIHPDDYALAKKLTTALKLELPPAAPPGYRPPNFDEPVPAPVSESTASQSVVEEISVASSAVVENFAADLQPLDEAPASGQESTGAETTAEETTAALPAGQGTSEEPTSEDQTPTAGDESQPAAVGDSDAASAEATTEQTESAEATGEAADADSASAPSVVDVPAAVRQPLPDEALINKCIKEWQVGARRVRNVVEALCDPFGEEDSAATGVSHAVMTKVPKVADLKVGDQVIGVIVGVTEFGAFVEMSPDCSGLVHVSRVADRFVEDLHEAVQVGDVITAWVTNVDPKRRRVGLSAISPEREMELERQRQERRDESSHRGRYQGSRQRDDQRGGQPRGGQNRGGQGRGGQGDSRTPASQGSDARRSAQSAGGAQAGSSLAGGAPRGDSRGRDARGGRPDSRAGGRGGSGRGDARSGGQRGGRRDRDEGPTSYSTRVPRSDTPATPITEAMAKGDEPLRSFGDLMQFFKKADPAAVVKPQAVQQEGGSQPSEPAVAQTSQPAPPEQATGHATPQSPAPDDVTTEGAAPES
ncbi:MAG: S1 RNA-binding domain-containing protein, partial [Planctomycetaceae bacterium]